MLRAPPLPPTTLRNVECCQQTRAAPELKGVYKSQSASSHAQVQKGGSASEVPGSNSAAAANIACTSDTQGAAVELVRALGEERDGGMGHGAPTKRARPAMAVYRPRAAREEREVWRDSAPSSTRPSPSLCHSALPEAQTLASTTSSDLSLAPADTPLAPADARTASEDAMIVEGAVWSKGSASAVCGAEGTTSPRNFPRGGAVDRRGESVQGLGCEEEMVDSDECKVLYSYATYQIDPTPQVFCQHPESPTRKPS